MFYTHTKSWNFNVTIVLRQWASLNTRIKATLKVDGFITGIQLEGSYLSKSILADQEI